MPKAILEFTIPDETRELKAATDAGRMVSALESVEKVLRAAKKYGTPTLTQEEFGQILLENGVTLDEY